MLYITRCTIKQQVCPLKSFLANTYNISAKAFPGIAEKFDKFLLRGLLKKNEISRI